MTELLGKHVNWNCIKGKGTSISGGFGMLGHVNVGSPMYVIGDCGITTSLVQKIEPDGEGYLITTKNSVYRIEGWKRDNI